MLHHIVTDCHAIKCYYFKLGFKKWQMWDNNIFFIKQYVWTTTKFSFQGQPLIKSQGYNREAVNAIVNT